MPYLSKREIESIAARVVNAYQGLVGSKDHCVQPICPEILLQELLGLSISYRTLSTDGSILGMTAFEQIGVRVYEKGEPTHFFLDGRTVLIESALTAPGTNPGRLHFTIVHEACHQIFRMLFPKEYGSGTSCRRVYCYTGSAIQHEIKPVDWEEWRVNSLAAAILMPPALLIEQMRIVGLPAKIRILNCVFAPKAHQAFVSIAEAIGVSKSALAIRMRQLGLLERDDLKDPYALVRVEMDDDSEF